MNDSEYQLAVTHAETLSDEITRPEPDWQRIEAHAAALLDIAQTARRYPGINDPPV